MPSMPRTIAEEVHCCAIVLEKKKVTEFFFCFLSVWFEFFFRRFPCKRLVTELSYRVLFSSRRHVTEFFFVMASEKKLPSFFLGRQPIPFFSDFKDFFLGGGSLSTKSILIEASTIKQHFHVIDFDWSLTMVTEFFFTEFFFLPSFCFVS